MIGFIGTGTIGAPMAGRLLGAGEALMVYDLDRAALAPLLDAGARSAESVSAIAANCTTVFLSLPGPTQIESVVAGADGLLAARDALNTIVDLSTNALALNRELAVHARESGVSYLDAPVSGGKVAAKKGELAIMVGGDEQAFERVRPLLERLGDKLFYLGATGNGTLAKLVNNQIFLCASVLIQEGFVLGQRAGMDPNDLLEVLQASSAGTLLARAPLILSRKFDLDVFALSIAAKDVAVALESAAALEVDMPMSAAAAGVYRDALAAGLGEEDFFATVKILESRASTELPRLRPANKA